MKFTDGYWQPREGVQASYAAEVADGPSRVTLVAWPGLRVGTAAPWRLGFTADGRVLTSAKARGTGFAVTSDGSHCSVAQLTLGVGGADVGVRLDAASLHEPCGLPGLRRYRHRHGGRLVVHGDCGNCLPPLRGGSLERRPA